jgi:hypothetical protein
MPTPTGLLRKGDRVRDRKGERTYEVIKRQGNDLNYSVILRLEDATSEDRLALSSFHPYGYPRDHIRLLEAGYWMEHGWRLVKP